MWIWNQNGPQLMWLNMDLLLKVESQNVEDQIFRNFIIEAGLISN